VCPQWGSEKSGDDGPAHSIQGLCGLSLKNDRDQVDVVGQKAVIATCWEINAGSIGYT
jgi:hypothetical protein